MEINGTGKDVILFLRIAAIIGFFIQLFVRHLYFSVICLANTADAHFSNISQFLCTFLLLLGTNTHACPVSVQGKGCLIILNIKIVATTKHRYSFPALPFIRFRIPERETRGSLIRACLPGNPTIAASNNMYHNPIAANAPLNTALERKRSPRSRSAGIGVKGMCSAEEESYGKCR